MSYSTDKDSPADARASGDAEDTALCGDDKCVDHHFLGDTGRLELDTRRVLVQLLLGPSVDGRRQSKLWPVLVRDELVVRQRLHELFLELVIDHDQKVAFTRQVAAEDVEIPILLRRANLSYLESVLVLFLRQRLTQADGHGERAVVSQAELLEHLSVYEKDDNADHARFSKQRISAIEKAKKLSLLQKIRGSDERFEVSPTLKLLFPAEEIQALTRVYSELKYEVAHMRQREDVLAIEGQDVDALEDDQSNE